jgi:hypothetical protein
VERNPQLDDTSGTMGVAVYRRAHTHIYICIYAHKRLSGSWLAFTAAAGRPLYISTEYYVSKRKAERKNEIK